MARLRNQLPGVLCLLLASVTFAACEKDKKTEADPQAATEQKAEQGQKAAVDPAAVKKTEEVAKAEPAAERIKLTSDDLQLTDQRRAAIESAVEDAKGFLDIAELSEKLQEQKLSDEKAAIAALDKLAKGKWLLLTGTLNDVKEDSLQLPVIYTQQVANDPMGMSKKFFHITVTDIEDYNPENYKGGQLAVFLVKYNGAQKADSARDLVASGQWLGQAKAAEEQADEEPAEEEAAEEKADEGSQAAQPAKQ